MGVDVDVGIDLEVCTGVFLNGDGRGNEMSWQKLFVLKVYSSLI